MNTPIIKVLTVCVVMILLGVAIVPIINAFNTTEEESTTETYTYGNNTLDAYVDTIASSLYGNVSAEYTSYRSGSDGQADPAGDFVTFPSSMLAFQNGWATMEDSIYVLSGNDSTEIEIASVTLPYQTTVYGTTVYLSTNEYDSNVVDVAVTTASNGVKLALPYNLEYTYYYQETYGDNSIHSLVLTDSVGDMTGTTFTPSAGGDWLQIPLHIMQNSTETYKVLQGETIYAPDTNGDLAAFTASAAGTISGTNSAVTLTLTQDTSITSATVYDLTATITDTDLPGLVIKKDLVGNVLTYPTNIVSLKYVGGRYIALDSNGAVYTKPTVYPSDNGAGTAILYNIPNVVDVWATGSNYYFLDSSDDLYVVGNGNYSGLNTGSEVTVPTKTASNVDEVAVTGLNGIAYRSGTDWYITGMDPSVYNGGNSGNSKIWTKLNDITPTTPVHVWFMNTSWSNLMVWYTDSTGDLYAAGNQNVFGNGTGSTSSTFVKVATDVKELDFTNYTQNTVYYISNTGELYATGVNGGRYGDGSTADSNSWVNVASGVDTMGGFTPRGNMNYVGYIGTDDALYFTSIDADHTTWAKVADNVDAVYNLSETVYYKSSGDLYAIGSNSSGQMNTGTTSFYPKYNPVQVATGVSLVAGYMPVGDQFRTLMYVTTLGDWYGVGGNYYAATGTANTNNMVLSSERVVMKSISTIYTNPIETETVADQRGTVASNVFTPSVDGNYLYIPILDAETYTYYVSLGSTVYAPNTLGDALAPHVVPDTTGIDPDVTITLTQVSGYDGQVYSVTATSTDSDVVGFAIPYTVTYMAEGIVTFGNNYVGGSEASIFTPTPAGDYLAVPYQMTSTAGFSYYIDDGDTFYYSYGGTIMPAIADDEKTVTGAVTVYVGVDTDGVRTIALTGGASGFLFVPRTYTDGTNVPSSISVTYTPVRGTVSGGSFTEDANGDYMLVYTENLQNTTYYVGDGRTYYVAQNGTVSETKTAPDATGLSHASLTFTALADPEEVYTVTGSADTGYVVLIPYTVTYDVTETVTKERIPLLSAVPLMLIVVFIVYLVSGLAVRRDY